MTTLARSISANLEALIKKHNVVGASAALCFGGESVLATAGKLDINSGSAVTPDSRFQIGSITKVMTTILALRCVDLGLLELDEPIARWLPIFHEQANPEFESITLRHLLSHTSGLAINFPDSQTDSFPSIKAFVDAIQPTLELIYTPGTLHSYCNEGFVLAGRLIELATNSSWEEAMEEQIFKPLNLQTAGFVYAQSECPQLASSHSPTDQAADENVLLEQFTLPRCMGPAGATCTMTASDLLHFSLNYIDLLSSDSAQIMTQPQIQLPEGSPRHTSYWSVGWSLIDYPAQQILSHDGNTPGQAAYLRQVPEAGFTLALLTNSPSHTLWDEWFPQLLNQLTGIELAARAVTFTQPLQSERVSGRYRTGDSYLTVWHDGDKLRVKLQGEAEGPVVFQAIMVQASPDRFDLRDNDGSAMGEVIFKWSAGDKKADMCFWGYRACPRADPA